MTRAYYNEIDGYCCDWLSNLMDAQLITPGKIDNRSIVDVSPDDVTGFQRVHFFAGIAGWDLALNLAGWGERECWTGSCPCQALSSAARGRNVATDRWPDWLPIIAASRPRALFGEQVAHNEDWLDRVCDDLDSLGYEIGAAVLPAVSVGADHSRPRIYFVGHADGNGQPGMRLDEKMAELRRYRSDTRSMVPSNGLPARMAVFSAFGNAIVPQVAAEFINAFMDCAMRPSPG